MQNNFNRANALREVQKIMAEIETISSIAANTDQVRVKNEILEELEKQLLEAMMKYFESITS